MVDGRRKESSGALRGGVSDLADLEGLGFGTWLLVWGRRRLKRISTFSLGESARSRRWRRDGSGVGTIWVVVEGWQWWWWCRVGVDSARSGLALPSRFNSWALAISWPNLKLGWRPNQPIPTDTEKLVTEVLVPVMVLHFVYQ
ncbi:hypothetical protein RchiOBHm_Chr7g0227961 [Rosa chinensis]|uniref:Uncharacterized protein n=1 Tax=Rosa chinensis TaxID=74649 RepID=A0A2P6PER4_ROSCH|nr:hypothetical protein RchiOBHm_Chr7g0227961 [Rosa chinensis]